MNDGARLAFASALNLPKDVVCSAAIITMIGRHEVVIENFKGIIEYNDNHVKINTKSGQLEILGSRLLVNYFTSDEMKITGMIDDIKYNV